MIDRIPTLMSKRRSRRFETIPTVSELSTSLGNERDAVLKMSAGLQLLPENATKWMRFERLREVAAGVNPNTIQREVTTNRLRHLLNTSPIASDQILANEDPFEESFTASVTYHGGSYRVVAGGASEGFAGCQLLLSAVESLATEECGELKNFVYQDATVLLTLSEMMCDRANLHRWELPSFSQRTPLIVPTDANLRLLSDAACFTKEQLEQALGSMSEHVPDVVAPLTLGLVDHD
ncbi:MAG: hypothetical protein ACYCSN_21110, partial [Acidobacteriaceae bacterium]